MTTTRPRTIPIATRLLFAVLAAGPFCLLQFAFLADSYSWVVFLFGYMGIVIGATAVFFGLAVYAFIEYRVRRVANVRRIPSFALAGGLLLLAFFVPAIVANPILLNFPQFCRVTQSIEWNTTKPHPEWTTNHSFILVLFGSGTANQHQFSSGYMNWTGNEPAGFSSIQFNPLSFNATELVNRMSASGLPDDEIETLSDDIWRTCTQIDTDGSVTSKSGVIDSIYCHVGDQWDYTIGGWAWVILTCLSFMFIGFKTIETDLADEAAV